MLDPGEPIDGPQESHPGGLDRGPEGTGNRHLVLLLFVLGPAILLGSTLCRTVYHDFDSAELSCAAAEFGVPHPPGSPLFVLLAAGLQRTFGLEPALAANLTSALAALAAVLLLQDLVLSITGSLLAAITAGWTLTASFTFWFMAIVAEVYTLQAMCLLGMLAFLARRRPRLAALCLGLSIANHPGGLFLALAVVLASLLSRDLRSLIWADRAALPIAAGAALIPYLYLPLASAFSVRPGFWIEELGLDMTAAADLWWFLSLQAYGSGQFQWSSAYLMEEASYLTVCLVRDFSWPAVLAGLCGLVALRRRRPDLALLIVVIGVGQAAHLLGNTAADKFTMFTPLFALLPIGVGVACAELFEAKGGTGRFLAPLVILLPFYLVTLHFDSVDLSRYDSAVKYSQTALSRLPPRATVYAGWQAATVLRYACRDIPEPDRPRIRHHGIAMLRARLRQDRAEEGRDADRALARAVRGDLLKGEAVFSTFGTPAMVSHINRIPDGLLYRLQPRRSPSLKDFAPVDAARPLLQVPGLALLKLTVVPARVGPLRVARLRYAWSVTDPSRFGTEIKTFLVQDGSGRVVPLGHESSLFQRHRLGDPGPPAEAGGILEEELDFSIPPAGSPTSIPPGGYRMGVEVEGRRVLAASFVVLATEPGTEP